MDKIHYYDGEIYRRIIDPNLSRLRQEILKNVLGSSKLIDIGCGTGALVIEASSMCDFAVGVDLSSKMIDLANRVKDERKIANVIFYHGGVEVLDKFGDKEFDFATFSMSLHEMREEERISFLKEAIRISKKVLIADYLIPAATFFSGLGVIFVEFVAGVNHFKNYLNFRKNGGIKYLVYRTGATIISKEVCSTIFEIVILTK